jgi:hypothetical protein
MPVVDVGGGDQHGQRKTRRVTQYV